MVIRETENQRKKEKEKKERERKKEKQTVCGCWLQLNHCQVVFSQQSQDKSVEVMRLDVTLIISDSIYGSYGALGVSKNICTVLIIILQRSASSLWGCFPASFAALFVRCFRFICVLIIDLRVTS